MTQTALSSLIQNTVDYAGLFPPAGLPMEEVIKNYATYIQSADRQMLGRLIIPAAKLSTLELPTDINPAWRISALIPPCDGDDTTALSGGFELIQQFNQAQTDGANLALVDAIEVKTPSAKAVHATADLLPDNINGFFEIGLLNNTQANVDDLIAQVRDVNKPNVFAKVRTGGVTPDLIPSAKQVAQFIHACARNKVGFKATAGLHHPVRAQQNLTYQPDSPRATMHGFLNVFIASMIAFEHNASEETLAEILSNESPEKFVFTDDHIKWNEMEVSATRVNEIRQSGIVSFGSCSFVEPSTELAELKY